MTIQSLDALLHRAVDRSPDGVALRYLDRTVTYAGLAADVNRLAAALDRLGVRAGDRVMIASPIRPEVVVAQYAVAALGAAFVMVNPAWHADEIAHAIALTGPVAVVAEAAGADDRFDRIGVRVSMTAAPGWAAYRDLLAAESPDPVARAAARPDADVALVYSSGTTGMPKAVRHTHASLLANVTSWREAAAIDDRDRLQLFLPLFHTYGIVTVATAILAGCPLRLIPRYDLGDVLANLAAERITIVFGATPVFTSMADRPDLESYDLSGLRYAVWGATPIVAATARRLSERIGLSWLAAYGASEAPVLCGTPILSGDDPRVGSAGRAVAGVELRIVDLETGAAVPARGAGEIQVRGPQVMAGYLPASADAETFVDGWLRTGDVGWVDEDGWLYVTDRVKEMLKVSAYQVAPVELERVLFQHPEVADCAVYGVPHDRLGELPKAAVVRTAGSTVTEAELLAWFEPRLARYKRLRAIAFVDAIPRTASGKVLRRQLRDADLGIGAAR